MTAVEAHEVVGYLTGNGGRPEGATDARIKTPFVSPVQNTRARLLHRPTSAIRVEVRARRGDNTKVHLAARFACGSSSLDVVPVREPNGVKPCPKCERKVAARDDRWTVYRYDDAEGRPLYVGQSLDLGSRHRTHSERAPWFGRYARLTVLSVHTKRRDALAAERDAIRDLRPEFNVVHNRINLKSGVTA